LITSTSATTGAVEISGEEQGVDVNV